MPFLQYMQRSVGGSVLTYTNLIAGASAAELARIRAANFVELQAENQNIRYTCDGQTDPTAGAGMLLLTSDPPKSIEAEDFRNLRVISSTGTAQLNIHIYAGRNVT